MSASDKHYQHEFQGVKLDPYRILAVYGITHPAQQHAIKKLLRAGQSVKDTKRDIEEVIMSLHRWLKMIEEDSYRFTGGIVEMECEPMVMDCEPKVKSAAPVKEDLTLADYTPTHIGTRW